MNQKLKEIDNKIINNLFKEEAAPIVQSLPLALQGLALASGLNMLADANSIRLCRENYQRFKDNPTLIPCSARFKFYLSMLEPLQQNCEFIRWAKDYNNIVKK
eukprot:9758753-Ditylum_brightwellii.AAC.1